MLIMTYTDTILLKLQEDTCNLSNRHIDKIQNKKIWKSLRTHILSRREKRKQAETDAQLLRKKLYLENQKIQENKLSLAQINSRLSELRGKRNELEEEKRALLKQKQTTEHSVPKTSNTEQHSGSVLPNTPNVNGAGSFTNGPFSQPRQTLMELLATQSDALSPSLINEYNPLSVVVPTKINGGRPNYWIIHHPK